MGPNNLSAMDCTVKLVGYVFIVFIIVECTYSPTNRKYFILSEIERSYYLD
jgi:hypothetical protein